MNSGLDIARARRETRHCEAVVHLNNAGAALMPVPVADTLHAYLRKEERLGGYEACEAAQELLNHFYRATARLLGCGADEIAFVDSATRAWQAAFYSFKFSPGDKILTTFSEYGSNVIAYNHQARRCGVKILFVPNDAFGQIDTRRLAEMIDDRVRLISISHIPTGGGLVNPAAAVGKIARAANVPFLLDACQAVGQLPLDVEAIGCDILCGTGRKYLRGPRGTGFLYVRRDLVARLDPPFLDLHAATLVSPTEYRVRPDARRFENWEQYFAGKAALGVAVDYAMSYGIRAIQSRIYHLAGVLREKLSEIGGVRITDEGREQCGIVTFTAEALSPPEIQRWLRKYRINVSTSGGSGSLVSFRQRGLEEVVRASLHYYNTESEIDYFTETLRGILARQA